MVCILLSNGFEEAEAIVPADLLRRAGVEVALTALEGELVSGSHQIAIKADLTLDQVDPDQVELVFLPGGMGGVKCLGEDPRVSRLVHQVYEKGGYVAAICAAPTLLAAFSLLEGKRAVCYPGMEDEMAGARMEPSVPFVADGRLVTGEAAGSAFPFSLKLVELLRGAETAQQVRTAVHYHG
ncbi:MAG: DJ-1/PfpI family protein [Oscillospiraceae bacterium]|jgi:4-methyl-5(b-hydroxyethyl)-thiazole monophosphate biosynthesis|nr:DJ-1/PfpI family protein [Oscillospiraceae bacterium]